jgi:hypothetical protein
LFISITCYSIRSIDAIAKEAFENLNEKCIVNAGARSRKRIAPAMQRDAMWREHSHNFEIFPNVPVSNIHVNMAD